MKTTRRTLLAALIAGAVGFSVNWQAACTSDAATSDVIFEGLATQSALDAMLKVTPKVDPSQAQSFTWASSGTQFSASDGLTLCWTSSATARAEPIDLRGITHPTSAPSAAHRANGLGALFTITETYADEPKPLTGSGFLLVMSTTKNAKLVRVFTTNHDYTPDPTVMKKLLAAGEPITAVVTSAYFTDDNLASMGGPFAGNAVTFTMVP